MVAETLVTCPACDRDYIGLGGGTRLPEHTRAGSYEPCAGSFKRGERPCCDKPRVVTFRGGSINVYIRECANCGARERVYVRPTDTDHRVRREVGMS